MGAGPAYFHPASPAAVASGDSGAFDTSLWHAAAIDISVNTITGGVTPSITFTFSRIGPDGVPYALWSSGALTALGPVSVSLSDAISSDYTAVTNQLQGAVFGMRGQLSWAFGGGTPPTSVNFSASVTGRSS